MMNDNPACFFLKPYRDNDGQARYAKANPFRGDAKKQIAWAWDTITGKAKLPGSIALYPTNAERKTCWAGMDFDAHDGDYMRARDLALKAFAVLYPAATTCSSRLTTSAGDPEHRDFICLFSASIFIPAKIGRACSNKWRSDRRDYSGRHL